LRDKAEEAARSRLIAGVNYPSDVAAGLALGRQVAALVITRGETDGWIHQPVELRSMARHSARTIPAQKGSKAMLWLNSGLSHV